jgi:hypothetical protein
MDGRCSNSRSRQWCIVRRPLLIWCLAASCVVLSWAGSPGASHGQSGSTSFYEYGDPPAATRVASDTGAPSAEAVPAASPAAPRAAMAPTAEPSPGGRPVAGTALPAPAAGAAPPPAMRSALVSPGLSSPPAPGVPQRATDFYSYSSASSAHDVPNKATQPLGSGSVPAAAAAPRVDFYETAPPPLTAALYARLPVYASGDGSPMSSAWPMLSQLQPGVRVHLDQEYWEEPGFSPQNFYLPASWGGQVPSMYALHATRRQEGMPPVPAPPGEPTNPNQPSNVAEAERLGNEPEDYSLQFLRRQTVLLRQGQWQFDIGVWYSVSENDLPVFVNLPNNQVGVTDARFRNRLLLVPMELRYGLTERHQVFVNVPFGWAGSEFSFFGFDDFSNKGGIGDVRFGISSLLQQGGQGYPDIVGTLQATAPTGDRGDFPVLTALVPDSRLGEGFWALTGSLLFIHTIDPVILFYGVGMRHRFEREFNGVEFEAGQEFLYQFGTGFAINPWVTLSGMFIGSYIDENRVNGQRLQGTILEPLRLRFAVTVARGGHIIEPFAEIGMTDDAPRARVGMTVTY